MNPLAIALLGSFPTHDMPFPAGSQWLIQVEEDHHRKCRQRCTGHALGRDGREVRDPGAMTGGAEASAPRVGESHGKEVLIPRHKRPSTKGVCDLI